MHGAVVIETSGKRPITIAEQTFSMAAGSVANVTIEVSGAVLTQLEKAHTMNVKLTTNARDSGKPPDGQTYTGQLSLTYR